MASVTITCACGEVFHADQQNIGRRIRCRRCGRMVEVRTRTPVSPSVARLKPRTKKRRRTPRPTLTSLRETASALLRATTASVRANVGRHHRTRRRRRPIDRVLTIAAWSYLAATLVIALVMWGLGDQWWPATLLLFIGRWILLLPLVPLVLLAIWRRRRLRAGLVTSPIILGALITLGPIMGGRLGWRRLLPQPEGMLVRVVTFNADGGRTIVLDLASLIREWNADIVFIQECGNLLAGVGGLTANWHFHREGGLCLATRFPIVSSAPMPRAALERLRLGAGEGIGGAGYVVRYTLATPRGPIDATNLHLETPRKGFESLMSGDIQHLRENTELRNIESELARRWVSEGHPPTLVAGDFNTPVESRIFQDHWGDLDDAFDQIGVGFGATKFNGWIRVRIDHVLYDDRWRPVRVTRGRDVGSDHRPLIVDVGLLGDRTPE